MGLAGHDDSPRRLAQYELGRVVGSGAMGVVHRARDLDLERPVAIKLLNGGPPERLLSEARAAARLIHPNVAAIYQVGHDAGLNFIVMEWLDGGDLGQAVKRDGPLSWRDAVAAARAAAAGLAAAHAAGLVHRDIKPSNLMRHHDGQVKLVDFGLARPQDQASDLTLTGHLMGTPAYLSPEQCRGEAATPLSDLYALGCTLFHLLAGRPPFAGPHLAAVLQGHLNEPMPELQRFVSEVPEAVCRIVRRAGAKRPGDRFADAQALHAALQAVLEGVLDGVRVDDNTVPIEPPRRDPGPMPGNLPLEVTSFIGRQPEIRWLRDLLVSSRLVTLTGPGGTGKTRLALHLAHGVAAQHGDGAWWVELAPLAAGQPIAAAVAAVFGVREVAGQDIVQALVQHLRPRELLLVLDNTEHVIDASADLASGLLAACPHLHLLVTSRQPLACPAEVNVGVAPLALADEGRPWSEWQGAESVQLFVDRARAARPAFVLGADNAAAVAQICRRLDGIPLAIELAAARIKVLSPAQIAERLDNAFQLLTAGQRSVLPRQQTLRALIDWSWDLLDAHERRLLARTSVFSGDFSLEAAETVLAIDGDRDAVLDGLAELVDKSLLIAGEHGGRMRYRLLETMRQYAAERLGAFGDGPALQRRHGEHAAAEFGQAVLGLHSAGHADAVARCRLEQAQASAALDGAIERRWFDIGLRLGSDLGRYWLVEGALADGVDRLDRLLALQPPPGAEMAALLGSVGGLNMYLGRHEQARAHFERGLVMARAAGRDELQARILNGLGFLARSAGDLRQSQAHVAEALAAWRRIGDRLQEAHTLNNLAAVVHDLGDVAQAREHLEGALALLREVGGARGIAYACLSLGDLELDEGRPDRARRSFDQGLALLSELGDAWGVAQARGGLGQCAWADAQPAEARHHFEQALAVTRQLGDRAAIAQHLDHLARLTIEEQQPDLARALALESLRLRLAINHRVDLAASLETQAALFAAEHPERCVMLLGCAEGWRDRLAQRVPAARQTLLDGWQRALRSRLGASRHEAALAAGRLLDAEQVARGLLLS